MNRSGGSTRRFADLAGFCSLGAGLVHAGAVGLHAEHPGAARVFVVLAIAQVATGLGLLMTAARWWKDSSCALVNAASVGGWVLTRTTGISWINGLEVTENPQTADVLCAVLSLLAVAGVVLAYVAPRRRSRSPQPAVMATVAAVLTVPALWAGATHVHSHNDAPRESALEISAGGVIVVKTTTTSVDVFTSTTSSGDETRSGTPTTATSRATTTKPRATATTVVPTTTIGSPQTHTHSTTPEQRLAAQSGWPRAFDPTQGPDFEGVAGVTEVQFQRARTIISATATDLAKYANVVDAEADGYRSIGDSITGYEHYIKWQLIQDGRVLDTTAPESLVYKVSGTTKTLVSAMYIAQPGTDINDPTLVNYAGPLMQWHVHSNLCWLNGKVVGITDATGRCRFGAPNDGILSPMVHVWIVSHPCGPFAAVEGVAAGVAQASDSERLDLCSRH